MENLSGQNEHIEASKKKSRGALPSWLIFMAMGVLSLFGIGKKRRLLHLAQNKEAWERLAAGLRKNTQKDNSAGSERSMPERNALERAVDDSRNDNTSGTIAAENPPHKADGETSGVLNEKIWIDDQNKLTDFIYGRESRFLGKKLLGGRDLSGVENTCEVIAVYNALLALGRKEADFPQLLERFERRGISLGGYFGTSFGSLVRFCRGFGLDMTVLKGSRLTRAYLSKIPAEPVRACIMMTENVAGDIRQMIHTVCITRERKNADYIYRTHNDYEGCRSYPTLQDAVFGYHKGKGRPLGVILLR